MGDFADLDKAFGGTGQSAYSGEANIAKWQNTGPFKGDLSGFWSGSFGDQGSVGYWWASSANPDDSNYAFNANIDPDEVNPGDNNNDRNNGFGVR